MHHNSLVSSTLHWKRLADQDAEEYLAKSLSQGNRYTDTRTRVQERPWKHTSPGRSVNTTRKTQYDREEWEEEKGVEEPDNEGDTDEDTEGQEPNEVEKPHLEEVAETMVRRRTKRNRNRTDKQESPTPPEEIPATEECTTATSRSNTKEGQTHVGQDEGGGKNNIKDMDIPEILTHTSMRIMSKRGEKLMESKVFTAML